MNTHHVKLASIGVSGITVLVMLMIVSQFERTRNGGVIIFKIPGLEIHREAAEIDIEKLLSAPETKDANKEIAKRVLTLYELDSKLLSAIEGLGYSDNFSIGLRDMQERMRGPFFAPDVKVELAFSDEVGFSRARVCADSIFRNQSMTIATEDGGNMDMIESANELLLHECPAHQRDVEKIIVAEKFGIRLLGTENPPSSVQVIAKAIPTIRFIHPPQKEFME